MLYINMLFTHACLLTLFLIKWSTIYNAVPTKATRGLFPQLPRWKIIICVTKFNEEDYITQGKAC